MSEENLILKNWIQQKDIFIKNLNISRKFPTKNSVHDLRVAVKKMRSYLRFNEEFSKEKWKELFAEIKELYSSFGKLRDFDISLQLCRKYEKQLDISLPAFRQYLSTNKTLTKRWTKEAAIKFNEQAPVFEFRFDLFEKLTITQITEKIVDLSNEKIKTVNQLKKHFHKNAHEIRKKLKDVFYWLKMCPQDLIERYIKIDHIDSILKDLGDWQDQSIFKQKLKRYTKEFAPKEEKELIRQFENEINNVQEDLLSSAHQNLVSG